MEKIIKFFNERIGARWIFIAVIIFIGFYKTLDFPFHANRDIGYFFQMTGGIFDILSLIKGHAFILFLNYKLFGVNPGGWYFTGILMHIFATWMVYIFVSSLLRNRNIGFATALWFGVSTAWHDAITIGTINSTYPAQIFLFLASLYLLKKGRESKSLKSYLLSYIVFSAMIMIRDSGILFFPILILFDFIFYFDHKYLFEKEKTKYGLKVNVKKSLKKLLLFLLPLVLFIISTLFFIFLRELDGGSPNDFIDHRAKLVLKLIADKEYFLYIKYGILGFFYYLPTHIIPYPILNFARGIITEIINVDLLKTYFFPGLGFIFYLSAIILTLKKRKDAIFKYLVFSLVFLTISTIFYSFAISLTEADYIQDYPFDEHRWRYSAFFGTSLFIIVYFSNLLRQRFDKKKALRISFVIISLNLILNIFLLWKIQDQEYNNTFKSQKLFQTTMIKLFPSYEKNNVLYFFPISNQFRDYLEEWHNLKNDYYPKLGNLRQDWSYEEMEKVLNNLSKGEMNLNNAYFVDFNPEKGVIDYTQKVRKEILNQKGINVLQKPLNVSESSIDFNISGISPVEFPYTASVTLKATLGDSAKGKGIDKEKFNTLVLYAKTHTQLLENMSVDVCNTSGKRIIYNPTHLIDGNLGTRSVWFADCGPDIFVIDLGKSYLLSGFLLGGLINDTLAPSKYSYEVSEDGKNWKTVMLKEENLDWQMMDKWSDYYNSRYIRVTVFSTQRGGFVQLDEAEPITAEEAQVFQYWSKRDELMKDLYNLFSNINTDQLNYIKSSGFNRAFARFSWETNLTGVPENTTSFYFPFTVDGQYHTYEIPIYESEAYSWSGQFLKRYIEKIGLDFGNFPGDISISDLRLIPKYPIRK